MQTFVTLGVVGIFLLVPVQFMTLPMNMSFADVLGFAVLPVCWIWLIHARKRIHIPFMAAMWAVLTVTAIACLASPKPSSSLVVLVKEIYLYVWMISLMAMFAHTSPKHFRWLLWGWLLSALGNGLLIIAQFANPGLIDTINSTLGGRGSIDQWRPSGLLANSNTAGLLQIVGLVPLILLRLRMITTILLGAILVLSVIGTGSMGNTLAMMVGMAAGVVGLAVLTRNWSLLQKLAMMGIFFGGLLVVLAFVAYQSSPALQERLEYMMTGRSERSASGRFEIWQRAQRIIMTDLPFWGVGPDLFKEHGGAEMHNDALSFTTERGFPGLAALLFFVWFVMGRSIQIVKRTRVPVTLVFMSALVAVWFLSLTHEIFHQRPIWLVLAVMEGVWWRPEFVADGHPLALRHHQLPFSVPARTIAQS